MASARLTRSGGAGRFASTILPAAATAVGALALLLLSILASSPSVLLLAVCYAVVGGVALAAHARWPGQRRQALWFATGFTLAAGVAGAVSFGPVLLPALLLWVIALAIDPPVRDRGRMPSFLAAYFGATTAVGVVVAIAYLG